MFVARVSLLVTTLALLVAKVSGIDCYVCTSLNGTSRACDDQFDTDSLETAAYIQRKCFYKFFRANFCVKLKGNRTDGTSITVRQCTDKDWGRHCGTIVFVDKEGTSEDIIGCLETCDNSGCNSASRLVPCLLAELCALSAILACIFYALGASL